MADPKITIRVEGSGLPGGGADGQVLSRQDGKPVWVDVPSELPEGGDPGDVLTRQEDGAAWIPPAKPPENVSELANDAGYLTASDAAPHQQLVTDADGAARWEDREFYRTAATIVPNATYGIFSSYGQEVAGNFAVPEIGDTCHVIFGSIETDKVAVAGNRGVRIGEDYSEFIIEIVSEALMYVETANTGPKVIEITTQKTKPLDECYIPGSIARTADIPTDEHINALITAAIDAIPSAEEVSF